MRLGPTCWGMFVTCMVLTASAPSLDHSAPAYPAARRANPAERVVSGESLYQLESEWTSDQGERMKLSDLAGSTDVLAMMFTQCPSLCPTLVRDLKAMDATLHGRERSGTRFVLVTIDPERDTPEALREYRTRMRLDPSRWLLLRGSASDTRELAAVLGFTYGRGDGKNYTHSSLVTVLDKGGVIVHQQTAIGTDPTRTLTAIESSLDK